MEMEELFLVGKNEERESLKVFGVELEEVELGNKLLIFLLY